MKTPKAVSQIDLALNHLLLLLPLVRLHSTDLHINISMWNWTQWSTESSRRLQRCAGAGCGPHINPICMSLSHGHLSVCSKYVTTWSSAADSVKRLRRSVCVWDELTDQKNSWRTHCVKCVFVLFFSSQVHALPWRNSLLST